MLVVFLLLNYEHLMPVVERKLVVVVERLEIAVLVLVVAFVAAAVECVAVVVVVVVAVVGLIVPVVELVAPVVALVELVVPVAFVVVAVAVEYVEEYLMVDLTVVDLFVAVAAADSKLSQPRLQEISNFYEEFVDTECILAFYLDFDIQL